MSESFELEGGIGAVVGGCCLVAGHLFNVLGNPVVGTPVGKGLVLVGHAVLVFAFVGVAVRQQAARATPIGRLGAVLSVLGTVLVTSIVFVELAGSSGVDPGPVFQATGASVLYTVGPLLFVLGMLLVGVSILRGDVLPLGSGVLLLCGTAVFAAASVVTSQVGLLTVVGASMTAGGFVWLGVDLLVNDGPSRPTRAF